MIRVKPELDFGGFPRGDGVIFALEISTVDESAVDPYPCPPALGALVPVHPRATAGVVAISLLVLGVDLVGRGTKIYPSVIESVPIDMVDFFGYPANYVEKGDPVKRVHPAINADHQIPATVGRTRGIAPLRLCDAVRSGPVKKLAGEYVKVKTLLYAFLSQFSFEHGSLRFRLPSKGHGVTAPCSDYNMSLAGTGG